MVVPNTVQSHPAAVDLYIRAGLSLVPIPAGTKGPRTPGWNLKTNALRSQADLPHGYGIGLAHAYSGTMALDIDNWASAAELLAAHDIDIQALYTAPDAVVIHSGKPGRGKLLYMMPFGAALPSKKIIHNGITAYELRCATASGATVQDVLPPSIHPETLQPYQWAGKGDWTRMPTLPQALLDLWLAMLEEDKQRTIPADGAVSASWDEIQQAIEAVSPDCSRDEWAQIGMALHWVGAQMGQLDQALTIWDTWSAGGTKYKGQREILQQWVSFKSDKVSTVKLGTLFLIAKRHGWTRPVPDASELFSSTVPVEPMDILAGLRPRPPDMEMNLWPAILRGRSQEIADSMGCDPIVPLIAGLGAVCGAVDARIRLELMPGFQVPPVLWLMTIGEPADKKSPGSKPMLSALHAMEIEDRPRHAKALLEWEGKEAAYTAGKKNFLTWSASPDALLGGAVAPPVSENPPKPVPLQIRMIDATSQAMVRAAADRPRGLLLHLDEMNRWVNRMNDKTSGDDRSSWVVAYESDSYRMDRVGAGSIHADNLAVSIYGNIQPQVFKANVMKLSEDGLLQRFIPIILRERFTKLGNPVPDYMTSAAAWENTLRLTFALPVQTYKLSPGAYTVFREFQAWYEGAKRDERVLNGSPEYMTAFGKLEGLTGRLILLFHIIEAPFSPQVDAQVVHRVVDLVRGYIIPAYRYALGEVGGLNTNDFEVWLKDHLITVSGDGQPISLRDLKRSARRPLDGKTDMQKDQLIFEAMHAFEVSGWVAQVGVDSRKPSWIIDPNLPSKFPGHREAVIKAKQRHADYIYRHAYDKGYERKVIKGYDPDTMDDT